MKGLFLLDVEEERRARLAREAMSREKSPPSPDEAAGEGGCSPPDDPGKPLEDYLARWHGNWRGSSSVK